MADPTASPRAVETTSWENHQVIERDAEGAVAVLRFVVGGTDPDTQVAEATADAGDDIVGVSMVQTEPGTLASPTNAYDDYADGENVRVAILNTKPVVVEVDSNASAISTGDLVTSAADGKAQPRSDVGTPAQGAAMRAIEQFTADDGTTYVRGYLLAYTKDGS